MKCAANSCSNEAVVRATPVRNRKRGQYELLCEGHANEYWESYVADARSGTGPNVTISDTRCFELDLMMAQPSAQRETIVLREVGGSNLVFFPTGYAEGCFIHYALEDSTYKDLLIFVILNNVLTMFGAKLLYVIVDGYSDEGFLEADAVVERGEETLKLQIRPSDAVALAISVDVPCLVAQALLVKIAQTGNYGRVSAAEKPDRGDTSARA